MTHDLAAAARVCVPICEKTSDGAIRPNPLFHRSWDYLHSRCIEYPYAASQWTPDATKVLDVGSAKSDPAWLRWLQILPAEVHATDYDDFLEDQELGSIRFTQGDVRQLPWPDESFDLIFAVSVIEHIGLTSPQVLKQERPSRDEDGDIHAVRELARLLRPEGRLVVTGPFDCQGDRLILGGHARCYNLSRLAHLQGELMETEIEFYEYQHTCKPHLYRHERPRRPWRHRLQKILRSRRPVSSQSSSTDTPPPQFGAVTWRRVAPRTITAQHQGHTDGIFCATWSKATCRS